MINIIICHHQHHQGLTHRLPSWCAAACSWNDSPPKALDFPFTICNIRHHLMICKNTIRDRDRTAQWTSYTANTANKCKKRITRKADFGANPGNLQGLISNTRGTFEPKTHARSHLKPLKILQKCDLGGPDICKKLFCQFLSTGGLNLSAKYSNSQKQI